MIRVNRLGGWCEKSRFWLIMYVESCDLYDVKRRHDVLLENVIKPDLQVSKKLKLH